VEGRTDHAPLRWPASGLPDPDAWDGKTNLGNVARMSDFFEPPPQPELPAPQRYRQPPWVSAPQGTLPGVMALEIVLARNDRVAICVSRLGAYPAGFEFDVVTMTAGDQPELDPMLFHYGQHPGPRGAGAIPPEMLRLGIQFSDGAKVTNTGGFHPHPWPPEGPIMVPGGGGGGGGHWRQAQWVWPLPPPGPLTLVSEWPAMEIPLTRYEIDAQVILDAAARAQVIFSDEDLPDFPDDDSTPHGWSRFP
jgi:hypothetical protein